MAKSYFTIEELCKSDTANKLGIDNTPPQYIIPNLEDLIEFLNPLREEWGSAIRVNSGYRCPELNKAVNGSSTSAHLLGYAADLYPQNNKYDEFKKFILDYLKDKEFDQCILEYTSTTEWVHLGLYNRDLKQRKMTFNLEKNPTD